MYKIWKYFEKRHPRACDYRMHETVRACPEKRIDRKQNCWKNYENSRNVEEIVIPPEKRQELRTKQIKTSIIKCNTTKYLNY